MRDVSLVEENLSIILVHPSRLYTEGLASLLKDTHYKIIHQLTTFDKSHFPEDSREKVIFIVGGHSALEITEIITAIREQVASAYILVINNSTCPSDVMSALEAGADGYLRDAISSQTFVRVIQLIVENETILPPEFVRSLRESGKGISNTPENNTAARSEADLASKVKLSARESSILRGLVDGAPNKVIAHQLHITEATVKVHVKAILRKIRVKNRTQAAIWATTHLPMQAAGSAGNDFCLPAKGRSSEKNALLSV